jgi:Flp pilus assembly protein TadG
MLCQIARLIRSKRGQGLLEFALIVPVLLLLLFGIIEFGRILNQQLIVSEAAREGARAYAVCPTAGSATTAANTAMNNLQAGMSSNATIKADTPSVGYVTVTVSMNVTIYTPLIGNIIAVVPGQTSSSYYTATATCVMATENGS